MVGPWVRHLGVVGRIHQYLKGATGQGILYTCSGHLNMEAYADIDSARSKIATDTDWAVSKIDKR